MIELEKTDYSKAIEPLKKVTINSLFARAVINGHVSGKVFVDNRDNPSTFYVVHPYGMSLLFGNHNNTLFNDLFKEHALNKNNARSDFEWMQAFPSEWDNVLKELFEDNLIKSSENKDNRSSQVIELNTRVNFRFDQDKYLQIRNGLASINGKLKKTTKNVFHAMEGSVVPANFWNNAADFDKNGVGFSFFYNEQLACTAYSAFLMDGMLELGMETTPKFRGKGIAKHTCSRLIDYCLENNLEPIWACRLENVGSFQLAKKLGFKPTIQLPYYRLSN